ncbi:MAG TPA: class I SAM-dependent methyltransferase [Bacteroidia bacterium]|nr:class I SAM-dependent methyltransferase [Bacteroidia bacterium]
MEELKRDSWESSYSRRENFIYYPKEEVVKFLNRFVRKRTGTGSFDDILHPGQKLAGLDFGCGIGRQVVLMEEFGIAANGVDISATALAEAEKVYEFFLGKKPGEGTFRKLDGTALPFADRAFNIAVCDSVLDSMYFRLAKEIVTELDRTVKDMLFISLIAPVKNGKAEDTIVTEAHEADTVQSYYDEKRIEKLLEGSAWEVRWLNLVHETVPASGFENARYHVVLKKRS